MTRFFAFVLALALAGPAVAQSNVGYVDLQKALLGVSEGKAAKAKLQKEFEKRQARLDADQSELTRLKEELDKKQSVMSPEVRKDKETELQQKLLGLQQTYMALQKELLAEEKKLTDRIFGKMEPILAEIAAENSLSMIIERNQGVLWAEESLDFTNELIRKYNRLHGKKKSAKKADASAKAP